MNAPHHNKVTEGPVCQLLGLYSSSNITAYSPAVFVISPDVHAYKSVITFGTEVLCHLSARNVTKLWPKPDRLHSAASLMWLQ